MNISHDDPATVECSWCHGTLPRKPVASGRFAITSAELIKTADLMDIAAREINRPEDGDRYTSNADRFQLRKRAEDLRRLAEYLVTL